MSAIGASGLALRARGFGCGPRTVALVAAGALAIGLSASISSAATLGKQFQISAYSAGPFVAALNDGGFVVANGDARARRYDKNGIALGAEFQVSTTSSSSQESPSVAGLSDGGFVVAYASADSTTEGDVYAQRYDKTGKRAGKEFRVNTTKTGRNFPSVARLGTGFVVVWQAYAQDGDDYGIYMQRFAGDGKRLGKEVKINNYTASAQSIPRVAALTNGGFIVTWMSEQQDGAGYGVYARRYDNLGKRVGPEFLVNTTTLSDQDYSAVAVLSNGGFVITWTSYGQDGDGYGVYAQRFGSTGARIGGEFHVSTATANAQIWPSVAAMKKGRFVITWESFAQDGDGYGVYAQAYTGAGAPAGGEFRVNKTTAGDQLRPSIAALNDGSYVVTWKDSVGVYGQRYTAP